MLVQKTGNLAVPLHLRNAPTKLMKDIGYGKEYKYAHQYEDNFVDIEFLPDQVKGSILYNPGNNPRENETRKDIKKRWDNKYKY
jgi:putative ATPase